MPNLQDFLQNIRWGDRSDISRDGKSDRDLGRGIPDDRYQRIRKDSDDRRWSCDDRSVEVMGAIGEGIGLTCGGERGDRMLEEVGSTMTVVHYV